jgi:hypothetical protein
MGKKTRSFLSAVALAFAVLFFGPAVSDAQAKHHGSYYKHYRPYRHVQPYSYYGGYYRPYRPYRLVRVLVYDPFPRWVYRRVHTAPPVYYAPPAYGHSYSPY